MAIRLTKRPIGFAIIAVWYVAVLVGLPLAVDADEAVITVPPALTSGPVLITEVQTGTAASGAEEFIELYNATTSSIDLAAGHWQLQIGNATATDWQSPYRSIALSGSLAPGSHFLIASQSSVNGQTVQYMASAASTWFSAGISAEGAHMRLIYSVNQAQGGACAPAVVVADELEWSTPDTLGQPVHISLDGRKPFITAAGGLAPDVSLQRFKTTTGIYIDTNNDTDDFALAATSPMAQNAVTKEVVPLSADRLLQDDCQPAPAAPMAPAATTPTPTTSQPPANSNLLAPQISELLPNPSAPQVDAADEFIELYNPNQAVFDLTGFTMDSGLTFNHTYKFPDGTQLPPVSFAVFYVKDTNLVLANSGSQVRLNDPIGNAVDQSQAFGAAPSGQAWILADDVWQWTSVPSPGQINIVSPPPQPAPKAAVAKPAAPALTKKVVKPSTVKKTSAVKASTTKAAKKNDTASPPETTAAIAPPPKSNPLHPGVLAAAAILALLYGAYEYRHDMANFVRKLRQNRASRRAGG